MLRRTQEGGMVVHDDAIVQDSRISWPDQLVTPKPGYDPDDIVALPLTRLAAGIDERRILAIDRSGGAIGISEVLVTIEDLNLIEAHQQYAAIALILAFSGDRRRGSPLKVELTVAKLWPRLDVPRARHDLYVPVFHPPASVASLHGHPRGEIRAVEQDHGIRRGLARLRRRARRAWTHALGLWASPVMYPEAGPRDDRCILVAQVRPRHRHLVSSPCQQAARLADDRQDWLDVCLSDALVARLQIYHLLLMYA
jgi:hypothetical protein